MASAPHVLEFHQRPDEASCLTVRYPDFRFGAEAWVLCQADNHLDHSSADHDLHLKHMQEVKERGATIINCGDFFCAMQGKWDPRASMSSLRPELRCNDYLNTLVEYNANLIKPFAKHYALFAPGNHEDSILYKHQFDLLRALSRELEPDGFKGYVGTMRGWVRFAFQQTETRVTSKTMHYIHGYGGGGPVTKDMIQLNRQLQYLGDVDIVMSSHTHDQWYAPIIRVGLDSLCRPVERKVHCVKLGCYKNEFRSGSGFVARKGHGTKPLGAWWLHFTSKRDHIHVSVVLAD